MRVVTWNVNGIRAAIRKGMDDWMEKIDADVWLLQEVRALPEQLPKDWKLPSGHEVVWHPAEKKGYSGVASFSRIGMEFAIENPQKLWQSRPQAMFKNQ